MKKGLLGFYDYTVILTYCGFLSAVTGIFCILQDRFSLALIMLMIAGGCDMFDGAVAATKSRTPNEKSFGIQIDSLSDLVSFGLLPALFLFCYLDRGMLAGVVAALYALCALIRLAYFNVLEEERQKTTEESRTVYLGLPVTTVALLLPAIFELHEYEVVHTFLIFPILMFLMAIAFLLPIRLKKPAKAGKIILIVLGVIIIAALLFRPWGVRA